MGCIGTVPEQEIKSDSDTEVYMHCHDVPMYGHGTVVRRDCFGHGYRIGRCGPQWEEYHARRFSDGVESRKGNGMGR